MDHTGAVHPPRDTAGDMADDSLTPHPVARTRRIAMLTIAIALLPFALIAISTAMAADRA